MNFRKRKDAEKDRKPPHINRFELYDYYPVCQGLLEELKNDSELIYLDCDRYWQAIETGIWLN
ncbi:MAG: hypothetical protein ACYSSI_00285 [Planctomycetota bacterium]|jgi:hypothetical protein